MSALKNPAATRESLTHERVVEAALQIVDRDGLEKLSMRRLGAELGVDPMAVYYYIPNKAALLDGLVEALMNKLGVPEPRRDDQGVVEWFEYSFGEFMDRLRLHPNVLPVMASRPITGESGMRAAECVLRELHDIGLPPDEAFAALVGLTNMTIMMAMNEVARNPETMDPAILAKVEDCYRNLSPEEFPLVLNGLSYAPTKDWTKIHRFAIRMYVTGLICTFGGNKKPAGE
jgi:TetR/AcrR family tetracycline transcriptional repressor